MIDGISSQVISERTSVPKLSTKAPFRAVDAPFNVHSVGSLCSLRRGNQPGLSTSLMRYGLPPSKRMGIASQAISRQGHWSESALIGNSQLAWIFQYIFLDMRRSMSSGEVTKDGLACAARRKRSPHRGSATTLRVNAPREPEGNDLPGLPVGVPCFAGS